MGSRGWIIETTTEKQQKSVKNWLLNVEHQENVDWSLRFYRQVKRDNQSLWALIDSDGSGCIEHLYNDFDYDGEVLLLGDDTYIWENPSSPLGSLDNATYSAYLDSKPDEFFSADDKRIEEQLGSNILVKTTMREWDFQHKVNQLSESSRLIAEVRGPFWKIVDGKAHYQGIAVEKASPFVVAALSAKNEVVSLDSVIEDGARSGFSFDGRTADIWYGDKKEFVEYPIEGPCPES